MTPRVLALLTFALAVSACRTPGDGGGGHPWPPEPADKSWTAAWHEYVSEVHDAPQSPQQRLPPVTVCDWRAPTTGTALVANPGSIIEPYAVAFGTHDVKIANTGGSPITITRVTLYECVGIGWTPIGSVLPAMQWVRLEGGDCAGATIQPTESCTVTVRFALHVVKAKLEIEDAAGVVLEVPLAAYP